MAGEYIKREDVMKTLFAPEMCYTPVQVKIVKELPAADVAPVRHGRWGDNGIPESILCGCSVCGFTCGASSFFYCPSCGAKMDGENEKKPAREIGQATAQGR